MGGLELEAVIEMLGKVLRMETQARVPKCEMIED
jgi:hypothetical protein